MSAGNNGSNGTGRALCENCAYWHRRPDSASQFGECRRRAPLTTTGPLHPMTLRTHWCGEWSGTRVEDPRP